MVRALFLDIDGTLVSFESHNIPQSTIDALTKAKERGVKIFIATGRPPLIITNLTQIDHLIDGYLSTNGAYCYVGDRTLRLCTIDKKDVDHAMEVFDREDKCVIVVGKDGMAIHNRNRLYNELFDDMLDIHNIPDNEDIVRQLLAGPVTQLTPFITPDFERRLLKEMPSSTSGRWHPEFTDITSREADKGKGLVAMAEALGLNLSETMAFGDGGNDLTILRTAGIGVAMGNALDEIKEVADYVTSHVDADGIKNALLHFGVI